jgi:hypothetical protein
LEPGFGHGSFAIKKPWETPPMFIISTPDPVARLSREYDAARKKLAA